MNPEVTKTKNRKPFPIGDRMVVEEMREEKTAGGILIPQHVKSQLKERGQTEVKFVIGKVLAVGEGSFTDAGVLVPLPVKVGDIIAYAEHHVLQYRLDGETFTLLPLIGIAARISDAPYPESE